MEAKHMKISCDSITPPKHPWFVSQKVEDEGDNTQFHIFYNIHDPMSHYRCQIPELLGKRIRGCFHGCWAVLSSNHPRDVIWSLWNPITSKIINLPPLNHIGSEGDCSDISEFCLSAPPEDPNSVLLLMRTAKPNFVYCRLGIDSSSPEACNRQELRWTESTYANQIKTLTDCDGLLHCLTCCNGKVYAYIRLAGNRRRTQLIVEVNIVINDCEIKKQREAVITLLPMLEFFCPFIVDCGLVSLLLKGSSTELFLVILGLKDNGKTVGAVNLLKLNMNNMTWEEIEDLKDTILSVELDISSSPFYSPAIASSEFGGYIHILADKGKIIYSYHVKDKTISFSSIPIVAGTINVSAWAMPQCTRLKGDRVLVHCKQEKESHKEDEMVIRSVKGNHEVESHLIIFQNCVLKMKEFCVGVVERLKLSPPPYDCRLESNKVHDDGSHLLNLPPHVLEMLIMEFCAGVEYLKFRATCKRCHLAAPLIPWNNRKASKIMQKYSVPSPWLIVFDKHKGIITLTDPVFGDKYFIKTPQELICDFQIKCSRFGWLLILKPDGSLMFFNPFTSDILELPELPGVHIICFSAPPTSPDCMVVGIAVGSRPYDICIHIVGGEPSWRTTSLNVRGDKFFKYLTFYGRDLYALREDGGFDFFREMGREDHAWFRHAAKGPASCCKSLPQCFQLICDQHLLRVIVGKFGESVEVFKKSRLRNWVKKDTLGKHVIFICGASSVCLDAKTPQMENKIYFPTSPIMYYSLETCRFHTLNNQDSFGDFFGTKHHLTPHGWIEPRWS
ncbi:hypothetical protein CTI12_AA313560 [Artemisia annua]|uniref:KIB1-4 beta-propeller domain-containing protein n=1 Tax=Artemisia annua TaxID=35608 RepID=A0A2U1N342_ARTAN|nr:hypothetical protein CTI12_AA313560 [Artemisia annua]